MNLQSSSATTRKFSPLWWVKTLTIGLLFWVPVVIFLKLAGEVIEKEPLGFDVPILDWFHAHASPFLDGVFTTITNVGGIASVIILAGLIVAWLLYKHRKLTKNVWLIIFGLGGAAAANVVLKALFHRDRPSLWHQTVVETGFSFPSGHAMASAALATCLVVMAWPTKWRIPAILIAGVTVLAIGMSRLYLGVHYPSDIIAGWCASVAWVLLVRYCLSRWYARHAEKSGEQ